MPMLDLYSTPSKFLECKFSSESGEVLNLGPICLKIDFRYKDLEIPISDFYSAPLN